MTSLREFFSLPTGSRGLGRDTPVGVDELGRQVYRTPIGQQYAETQAPRVNIGEAIAQGAQAFRESPSEATRNVARALVQGAWNGVSAPGRALRGETVTYGDVADTTLDWGIMGAVGRAPEGSLRIFAGRNAQTADSDALRRAEDMMQAGASRDDIWRDTGWFQGVDGQWRFEIDDSAMDVTDRAYNMVSGNEAYGTNFRGAFDHPELMRAYDEIAPFHGDVDFRLSTSPSGQYYSDNDAIRVGAEARDDFRSVGLHELQHAVQQREGLARGSNPTLELALPRNPISYDEAYDAYRRSAGEVEARNVQTRRDFTPGQRRATPPWATQDVPDADQIVRMGAPSLEALRNYIRGAQ